MSQFSPNWDTKLRHHQPKSDLFHVPVLAEMLGISKKTLHRWCQSGELPSFPKAYGKTVTYVVSIEALSFFMEQRARKAENRRGKTRKAKPLVQNHADVVPDWVKAMRNGGTTGKAYSERTIKDYQHYIELYFAKYTKLKPQPVKAALMRISVEQFCKREHYYKACLCFAKYLVSKDYADKRLVDEITAFRPKRHKPPKQQTVPVEDFEKLLAVATSPLDKALLVLLAETGIRANECCFIKLSDIDLNTGLLCIEKGKGGKRRKLGLNEQTIEAVKQWLEVRPEAKANNLFLNRDNTSLTPRGVHSRLAKLGKLAGVWVSPHGLRRHFVTKHLVNGKSLVLVQEAVGHSSVITTRNYCKPTEQEVINAMKHW